MQRRLLDVWKFKKFKQHNSKHNALRHKDRSHKRRSLNNSFSINKENTREIFDDLSLNEAITEELFLIMMKIFYVVNLLVKD